MASSPRFIDKQIVYVNSRNKSSGTDSDFLYYVPLKPENEFDSVVVIQAVIPKTWYLFPNGHNTFILQEDTTQVTITVPIGNYSRISLVTVLQGLLRTASPNGLEYNVENPDTRNGPDTGLMTFTITGPVPAYPISLIFGTIENTYTPEPLGFSYNSTNLFTDIDGTYTLVSTNVINLQSESSIFIHSDCCQNVYGADSNNILQEIYGNAGNVYFSNILFQQFDAEANSKTLATNKGNYFRFYLTNEDNIPIEFTEANCQMTLLFYKSNDSLRGLKGFIKMISGVIYETFGQGGTKKDPEAEPEEAKAPTIEPMPQQGPTVLENVFNAIDAQAKS